MSKKKILITEDDLVNLILKSIFGGLNQKDSSTENDKIKDEKEIVVPTELQLNLDTEEGRKAYVDISNKLLSGRQNPLGITGQMMLKSAEKIYPNYLPPEFVIAQWAQEGAFVPNTLATRGNNPGNILNYDNVTKKTSKKYPSTQEGINAYYELLDKDYLRGKNIEDLLNSGFKNYRGGLYATDPKYTERVKSIMKSNFEKVSDDYASLDLEALNDLV